VKALPLIGARGRPVSPGADYAFTMRLSARNQLPGTVVSVVHGAVLSTVTIQLAGGDQVVAAITRDSAEGLELAEGDQVTAVIKATEVMVGKE
jgi:molybdopterin-binding protein